MKEQYTCRLCGGTVPATAAAWRCGCGGPLDPIPLQGFTRKDIQTNEPSLWRYSASLRNVRPSWGMYFHEGMTPIVRRFWRTSELLFKYEGSFPSGSFKDRGTAVMLNHLASLGVTEVLEDSSGNGGASVASYSAAGGIHCHIYVPESTSRGKIVQLKAYGAEVHLIPGTRQDTAAAAAEASSRYVYASHNWQPMFIEGVKTVAFELWEQCGFTAPSAVVVPASYGSNLIGLYRGFQELIRGGEIQTLPRLYAVQSAAVSPLTQFLSEGIRTASPAVTVAEGIAATHPIRLEEMAEALKASGGRVVTVDEDSIISAQLELARTTGLYVEPTSAVAAAAAAELSAADELDNSSVVILTGSGLKATDKIGDYLK